MSASRQKTTKLLGNQYFRWHALPRSAVRNLRSRARHALSASCPPRETRQQGEKLVAAKIGQPFEHDDHLKELARRQDEIVKQLDLTRNQASSRLEATETAECNALNEKPEETHRATRQKRARVVRV